MIKKKSRFLSALLTFIIAVAMIVILYATVSADNKSIFGYRLFIVATGSMAGTIDAGEIIIAKSVSPTTLKVRDIITFTSNDPSILGEKNTHRIIKIEGDRFFTRGDANQQADSLPTTSQNIIGKVIFHSKTMGFIIRTLSKPLNMLLFLVIPIAFMAITDIRNAAKKVKEVYLEKNGENKDDEAKAIEGVTPSVENFEQSCDDHTDSINPDDDNPTLDR